MGEALQATEMCEPYLRQSATEECGPAKLTLKLYLLYFNEALILNISKYTFIPTA